MFFDESELSHSTFIQLHSFASKINFGTLELRIFTKSNNFTQKFSAIF